MDVRGRRFHAHRRGAQLGALRLLARARGGRLGPDALRRFARSYFGHYLTHAETDLHRAIARTLLPARAGLRAVVIAPRDSAKSTWASLIYPLFSAVLGLDAYILLVSETRETSEGLLEHLREELAANRRLRSAFPWALSAPPRLSKSQIQLAGGTRIRSLGMGTSMRGTRLAAARPSLIVCDDLQDFKHAWSATRREAAYRWFLHDLLPLGDPRTRVLVIGNAVHPDAIASRLVQSAGWEPSVFAMIRGEGRHEALWRRFDQLCQDPRQGYAAALELYERNRAAMDAGCDVLWPQRYPYPHLRRLRLELGEDAFALEYQSDISRRGRMYWPPEYATGLETIEALPASGRALAYVDLATGRAEGGGDYTAAVILKPLPTARVAVEPLQLDLPPEGVAAALVRWFGPRRVDSCTFEANAFQVAFEPLLRKAAEAAGLPLALHAATNTLPKQVRIARLGELLQDGVFALVENPHAARLRLQIRDFPDLEHDDLLDALAGGTEVLLATGGADGRGRLTDEGRA